MLTRLFGSLLLLTVLVGSTLGQDRPTVFFLPFDIQADLEIGAGQVDAALLRAALSGRHFRRLTSQHATNQILQFKDPRKSLSELQWRTKPDYLILSPSIFQDGDQLAAIGVLATVEQAELAVVEARGADLTELMRRFWKELDRPVGEIGAPSLIGCWVQSDGQRRMLMIQRGADVFGRVIAAPRRLYADSHWYHLQAKLRRQESGGWQLVGQLHGYDQAGAAVAPQDFTYAPDGHNPRKLNLAGSTWRRENPAGEPNADALQAILKQVDALTGANGLPAADAPPLDRKQLDALTYEVHVLENAAADYLKSESDRWGRRAISDQLWDIELAANACSARGSDLLAGIPIIGDWDCSTEDFEKFVQPGNGAVFALRARLVSDAGGRERDRVEFIFIESEEVRPGLVRGKRTTHLVRPSSTLRFDATKVQFVKVGNRVQETKLGFFGQSVAGGAISVIHRFTRDGEIITSRAMTLRR